MVNATIEIPEKKVRFSGLEELRSELRNQAKNREYLAEFEKTIDAALSENERDGIIEFTENEWQDLITNENLPPIEQVKELLNNKIRAMREVTAETKEKTGGLAEEFTARVDEVRKGVTEKVDEVKEKSQAAITEALSPLQKIKDSFSKVGTSIADMWSNIWTPVKFAWYTLWATLGFKFGKEALAAMTKEKAEKVIEAGKEKAGKIITEGEEKEGGIENLPVVAGLSATALGIFGVIKSKLPAGLGRSLEGSGGDILKSIARNKALRMFGIGGTLLFGISQVGNAMENPEIAEKVGPMPEDVSQRKTWIQKVLIYCVDMSDDVKSTLIDFFSQSKDVITGKTLDEYLTKKESEEEIPEDMQRLEEAFGPTLKYLEELKWDVNYMVKNGAIVIAGASVISPSIRAIALRGTMTSAQLGLFLLSQIGKNIFSTLFVIAAVYNATVLAGHKILVPRDPEKMQEWLRELIQLPDVREHLEKEGVDASILENAQENLEEAVILLTDEEKREERLKQERERVMTQLKGSIISLAAPERKQVIQSKNIEGFRHAEESLTHFLKEPSEREKALIKKLQTLIVSIKEGKEITASDIADLMTSSTGTRVNIHNKNNSKYIRWSIHDEAGFLVDYKATDNLCVNPKLEQYEQYHAARTMPVAKNDGLGAAAAGVEGVVNGARYPLTQLREALNTNKLEEGATILQKILNNKIPLIQVGSEVYIDGFLFPANLILDTFSVMNGDITLQEFMMETGDGIVPCMIFGATTGVVQNGIKMIAGGKTEWKMGRMLFSGFTGIKQGKMIGQGVGLVFHGPQKFKKGYEGILGMLTDTRVKFEVGLEQMIQTERKWRYAFGGVFNKNMKELSRIASDLVHLEKTKRHITLASNSNGRANETTRKEHIKKAKEYAQKILKDLPDSEKPNHILFRVTQVADDMNGDQIKNLLQGIEGDINTRTGRRIVIRAEQQINIRRQAAAVSQLPRNHPRWSRLSKAKGIAGILAIIAIPVGAALGADALNNHEATNEDTDDLGDSYEATDYGDFEADISKSDTIDNHAPEMRSVFQGIDEMKDTLIGEDDIEDMKLMIENNVDFYMKNDENKVKNLLAKLTPRYEASVIKFRKICQDNKEALERYFRENPDKQDKELKICAFLGLGWADNKLEFRSMSREKFERHFYSTFDHIQNNLGNYEDDGRQSGWEKTGEVGKNITPVWSSWLDTKQTWKDFSRGHIKSGLINGSMAAIGWTSDALLAAGIITSPTVVGALGFGGAAAGLRGLNVFIKGSKVVRGIKKAEIALETVQQTAQGIYLAVEKDQIEYL